MPRLTNRKRTEKIAPITGAMLAKCFEIGEPDYKIPDEEYCSYWADSINQQAAIIMGNEVTKADLDAAKGHLQTGLKSLEIASGHLKALSSFDVDNNDALASVSAAIAQTRSFIDWRNAAKRQSLDWQHLACWIACVATQGWRETGRQPKNLLLHTGGLVCRFTWEVLAAMNLHRSPDAVSDALLHKSGRNSRGRGKSPGKVPLDLPT